MTKWWHENVLIPTFKSASISFYHVLVIVLKLQIWWNLRKNNFKKSWCYPVYSYSKMTSSECAKQRTWISIAVWKLQFNVWQTLRFMWWIGDYFWSEVNKLYKWHQIANFYFKIIVITCMRFDLPPVIYFLHECQLV